MFHHHHQENCSSRSLIIQQSPSIESTWTEHDHWLFLNALVNTPEDIIAGRWEKIAEAIPGKTAEEVKAYYDGLEHEIKEIEAGRVELPVYLDDFALQVSAEFKKVDRSSVVSSDSSELLGASTHQISFGGSNNNNNDSPTTTSVEKGTKKKKKGNPWSVDEHRRFLEGLKIYGKGDWRMISRNVVCTRTASQVASHAQKYFIRQEKQSAAATAGKKQKKRSSIHDITTTSDTAMVVHTQSTPLTLPSTPPTPPPATNIVYSSGQARGVDVHYSRLPPPQPISFYSGCQEASHDQSSLITSRPQPEINNFYGSEGSSTGIITELPLITPMPISFCSGEGALLPPTNNNLYREGQVMSSPLMTDFYSGATPPPPPVVMGDGDGFLQNLLYQPFF